MLTAFRSNTPSFASCNKVTNLVVSSPRLFSCLLGVCGCSESPTAPSSPLLLADSSSIITRDQLRTSPLPSRPNPASESRKAIPSAAVNQPECRGRVWRSLSGVSGVSPTRFPPTNSSESKWTGSKAIQWASVRQAESRWPREVWRDSSIASGIVCEFLHRFSEHGTRIPIIYTNKNIISITDRLIAIGVFRASNGNVVLF